MRTNLLILVLIVSAFTSGCNGKFGKQGVHPLSTELTASFNPSGSIVSMNNDLNYNRANKRWLLEELYPNQNEEVIYKEIRALHMHYLYSSFLEAFPSSNKKTEVKQLMNDYAVFETNAELLIPFKELESKYNYNGVKGIYRWNSSFTGIIVASDGEQRWVAPMCLGNIQFLSGGIVSKEKGPKLLPGTKFIYPLSKPNQ